MDIDLWGINKFYSIEEGVEELHPELIQTDEQIRFCVQRINVYKAMLKCRLETLDRLEGEENEQ